jgi:16S rRNA (guanine1207-N2)-methyltransferase
MTAELLSYYTPHQYNTVLAGRPVLYFSKPGLPDGDQVSPSMQLLAIHVHLAPGERAVLMGCRHGALAATLAGRFPASSLELLDFHYLSLSLANKTLELNRITNASVHLKTSLLPEQAGQFEAVIIDLPKGRKLTRRWLVEAEGLLKPEGRLYLAGPNRSGIQASMKDAADLFGEPAILGFKKGNRLARYIKRNAPETIPDWATEPGARPGTWNELDIELKDTRLRFKSAPGLFSSDDLDEGTRLLLENMDLQPGEHLLDFGCGYGPLGLFAAAWGAGQVDMVDVNLLAVEAARLNAAHNRLDQANIFVGDVLDFVENQRYSLIISNPPFHSGHDVNYEMAQTFIVHSAQILEDTGRLILVANRFIRYDRIMRDVFREVEITAETGKFQVWTAWM